MTARRAEQYYGFGEDVLAVADGRVVSVHDGMTDQTPFLFMVPKSKSDYGGNNVIEEIAPNVFAWYAHLRQGSLTVKVGDSVKAGAPIGKLGNTGPSEGPHLHLGLSTSRTLSPDGACRSSSTVSPWSALSISTLRRGIDWWFCRIHGRFGPPIRSMAASRIFP